MEEVLSRHTGRAVERLRADTDRDKIFTAEEAVAYGLADQVIGSRKPLAALRGLRPPAAPGRRAVQGPRIAARSATSDRPTGEIDQRELQGADHGGQHLRRRLLAASLDLATGTAPRSRPAPPPRPASRRGGAGRPVAPTRPAPATAAR